MSRRLNWSGHSARFGTAQARDPDGGDLSTRPLRPLRPDELEMLRDGLLRRWRSLSRSEQQTAETDFRTRLAKLFDHEADARRYWRTHFLTLAPSPTQALDTPHRPEGERRPLDHQERGTLLRCLLVILQLRPDGLRHSECTAVLTGRTDDAKLITLTGFGTFASVHHHVVSAAIKELVRTERVAVHGERLVHPRPAT